jgi:hypothetical protein
MESNIKELLTWKCLIQLDAFAEQILVKKVSIWCSREAAITIGACESYKDASGLKKLGTEDATAIHQLLREYEGVASKGGGLR